MYKHIWWTVLGLSLMSVFIFVDRTSAVSDDILISQVQFGDAVSASNEFIELKNNNAKDIDVTDWCIYYSSWSNLTNGSKLSCLGSSDKAIHIFIPGDMSVFFVSNAFNTANKDIGFDMKFSSGLSGTGGHLRLLDNQDSVIDKLGWGTAMSPESFSANVPASGRILSRIVDTKNKLQDTDNNLLDFASTTPKQGYAFGNLYEVVDLCLNQPEIQLVMPDGYVSDNFGGCRLAPIDICRNIEGMQEFLPIGYGFAQDGNCVVDVCGNIDEIQSVLLEGFVITDGNQCHLPDACLNLDGLQEQLPEGYYRDDNDSCWLDLLSLRINEIMPNPAGDDLGKEFIELYNPNDIAVPLHNYKLLIGTKYVLFTEDADVKPMSYYVINNSNVNFTLTNTGLNISLWSLDDRQIGNTVAYVFAPDDQTWAYIGDSWSYTNQPTPGSENMSNYIDPKAEVFTISSEPKPCAPNQYRSAETNRCRLLTTVGSVIVPCKDGQYRSEITNRCRNISSDASVLAACDDNQERNPETNRCRNIVSTKIPDVAFAVEPFSSTSTDPIQWLSFGAISFVAVFYAIWEWKPELRKLFTR